ncbi:MAG TPA: sulfotransferase [Aestuariivirga sp.]|nr:sulfotransferase [Aestuariivirga sp.]
MGSIAEEIAGIQRLLRAGRGLEAETAARKLQLEHPVQGDVNHALALVLIKQDKDGEALLYAKAAVKAEPQNAAYLISLGRLYLKYEVVEDALPLIEKALRYNPSLYEAPRAMGEFFYQVGNGHRAASYLKQALALSPSGQRHQIEMQLVEVLSSLGETDEAERLLGPLTAIDRFRVEALVHLAGLRKHTISSGIFGLLQQELEGGSPSPEASASLHNVIGRIYENCAEYSKAFEHFRKSKEFLKKEFDFEALKQTVNSVIEDFTSDTLKEFEGYGDPSRLPVFVVGMPRSGTTLTEQIIAAHPKAAGVGELERIGRMRKGLSGGTSTAQMLRAMRAGGPPRVRLMADSYLGLLKFLAPTAKRVVDKMPQNFLRLGFIALLFPNARIVHCQRDPADTFVSAFQNMMLSNHSYSYSPEDFARYYKEYSRLMSHWNRVLPGRIFNLRYEDLVSDPETKTRDLLEFLRLPWNSRCLRFHETDMAVKTFSKQQVRSPVNRNSVGKWRNYQDQLQPLLEILADNV